jgi:crotonobetainyl-CoA:carnitine CoA-transferase CaiB-like acyl-CoA transferase
MTGSIEPRMTTPDNSHLHATDRFGRSNGVERVVTGPDPTGAIRRMHERASNPGWRHVVDEEVSDDRPQPLDGVRILAVEQMQALPFATQLLGRLGADVVKVEHPVGGDMGRGSAPSIPDADREPMGATFLRNNLGKRSIALDLKTDEGRNLFRRLAPRFDIVAQNLKTGAMERLGLGYDDLRADLPGLVYLSVSGYGSTGLGREMERPAYASIAEAMSGLYAYKQRAGDPPRANPVGGLGDISAALFATVGVLAALRHRDVHGAGQHVDIAMVDSVVSMTDTVTNFWSMGIPREPDPAPFVIESFRASDGWFVVQIGRRHEFERLAEAISRRDWTHDPRFEARTGWHAHLETELRPAIERWAATLSRAEVCSLLAAAGVAAGPCATPGEVAADPILADRAMLVAIDGPANADWPAGGTVLTPGNPVKLSAVDERPDRRPPRLGENTEQLLRDELGLGDADLADLRARAAIR